MIVLGSREGYDATAERPFGKCHVLFFISPLSFTFPQPSSSSEGQSSSTQDDKPRGPPVSRFHPANPAGCCWVRCSSWVGSRRCFLTGELSHVRDTPNPTATQDSSGSAAQTELQERSRSQLPTAHKSRPPGNTPLQTWARGLRISYTLLANFSVILK